VTRVTVGSIVTASSVLNAASCESTVSIVSIEQTSLKRQSRGNDVFNVDFLKPAFNLAKLLIAHALETKITYFVRRCH